MIKVIEKINPRDAKNQIAILHNILTINGILDPLAIACLSDLNKKLQEMDKLKADIVALQEQLKLTKADYNDLARSKRKSDKTDTEGNKV
jgi:hypothetical protein